MCGPMGFCISWFLVEGRRPALRPVRGLEGRPALR